MSAESTRHVMSATNQPDRCSYSVYDIPRQEAVTCCDRPMFFFSEQCKTEMFIVALCDNVCICSLML